MSTPKPLYIKSAREQKNVQWLTLQQRGEDRPQFLEILVYVLFSTPQFGGEARQKKRPTKPSNVGPSSSCSSLMPKAINRRALRSLSVKRAEYEERGTELGGGLALNWKRTKGRAPWQLGPKIRQLYGSRNFTPYVAIPEEEGILVAAFMRETQRPNLVEIHFNNCLKVLKPKMKELVINDSTFLFNIIWNFPAIT